MWVNIQSDNQFAPTSKWTFNGTGNCQEIKLLGHNETVAGLVDASQPAARWKTPGMNRATAPRR